MTLLTGKLLRVLIIIAVGLVGMYVLLKLANFNKLTKKVESMSVSKKTPVTTSPKTGSGKNTIEHFVQKLKHTKKAKTLFVLADSHGIGLLDVFKKYLPGWRVKVDAHSGFEFAQLSELAKKMPLGFCANQSYVILHAGTNNFYVPSTKKLPRERDSDAQIIQKGTVLLKLLRQRFPKAVIIYSANLPRADIKPYAARKEIVNKALKANMAAISRSYFVDHKRLFQSPTGVVKRNLLKPDLLHMNKQGQQVLITNLIKVMANDNFK